MTAIASAIDPCRLVERRRGTWLGLPLRRQFVRAGAPVRARISRFVRALPDSAFCPG
jgi:hypothetical protein